MDVTKCFEIKLTRRLRIMSSVPRTNYSQLQQQGFLWNAATAFSITAYGSAERRLYCEAFLELFKFL